MTTFVKICGITRVEDARAAASAGASAIGINFWPGSRRFVADLGRAGEIAAAVRGALQVVGVFVNQERAHIELVQQQVGLDLVQLHGDESDELCRSLGARLLRAVRLGDEADLERVSACPGELVLVDAVVAGYGGQGVRLPVDLARRAARLRKVVLAGGLGPDNVAEAIRDIRPYGVDVASGVETAPGLKDAALMERFVLASRRS